MTEAAFSRHWPKLSERAQYRLLEMIPGILVWSTFSIAIIFSFLEPIWAIVFIILFDVYWFVRAVYVLVYLLIAFRRYQAHARVSWRQKLKELPGWQAVQHLVVIPTFREPYEVIAQAFRGLARSTYPLDHLIVVLACEERDGQRAHDYAQRIWAEFSSLFRKLIVSFHPTGIPGELSGKGSNIAWAGRQAKAYIDEQQLPYEQVVVTTLDVDSVVHPEYFSYLTYTFLNHPRRLRTSYQPLAFYHNNIWESPALARTVANATTFWLMTETVRPDRLFTFSSHSMPFTALVDVGFWQNDIVTEDSRIFLQCFIEYDGDYTVTPLYLPISMDTVASGSIWRTMINQYRQQRRWAYGVENFPFMVWNFVVNPKIPLAKKLKYIWNQLEGVYSWATAPILIFILGWLPITVANSRELSLVIVERAPEMLNILMSLAMVGLVAMAVLASVILPPPPRKRESIKYLSMILQWVLFPITMIVFGSIPATDAQTRLMSGKYLGFWVTEKSRKVNH